jgi:hypothetical protein
MTMHLSWAVGFLAANLPGFAVPRLQVAPALRRDATPGVEPR